MSLLVTRRRFVETVVGLGVTAAAPVRAHGDDRVRVVTGLRATFQSLGWIGTESGIFKRLGLDVAFPRLETGGPEAEAGLGRGDWEVAETGTSPIIQGVLAGRDGVIVLVPTRPAPVGPPLLARRGITEPSQLNGVRIGVLTETGQTSVAVRATLRTWAVTASLVPLGTFAKIYETLGRGEIDAGALPFDYRFLGPREFGLNVLETPPSGFQSAVVATTRRLIGANRGLVARLVQGYVETIHFFKTQRGEAVPLLQRFLGFKDRGAVEDAWDFHAPLFQATPRPTAPGIQKLLDELALKQPAARGVTTAAILDTSFLDDLERSGFVKKLYGSPGG